MAKRQFELSEVEKQALLCAEQQTRKTNELRHVQAVRLYGTGEDIHRIKEIVQAGVSSIREWVGKYQSQGLAGLQDQRKGHNANKLSAAQRAELREKLPAYRPDQVISPDQRNSSGPFWSVNDLRIVVERWYGVVYASPHSYTNLFQTCGFSYQKAEKVYRSRPNEVALLDFEAELEKKWPISYKITPPGSF
jgi:transposase